MSLHTCSHRESLAYTAFYCEENIWKLCERIKHLHSDQLDQCYAIFISNHNEMVPIWGQKAGDINQEYLVVWDYHVILVHMNKDGQSSLVYDFDTILDFPVAFDQYCSNNLRDQIKDKYAYMFRVIPAEQFLQTFASDRSRMRDKDGNYIKPPPPYDLIQTANDTNNLNQFISMDLNYAVGQVMSLSELRQMFQTKK